MSSEGPRAPAELVFVGGTGRSGTHVVAEPARATTRASPRSRSSAASTATRKGLADLVTGAHDPGGVRDASCGRFWWHRVRVGERGTVRAAPPCAPAAREARSAASTRSSSRDASRPRSRRSRRTATRRTSWRSSRGPLLRPARAARRGAGKPGAGRDELLHDRLRARPGPDLPRGALRPLRARRPRLGLLEGLEAPEVPPPDGRGLGRRVVGGAAALGRGAAYRGLDGAREASTPSASTSSSGATARPRYDGLRGLPGLDDEPGMRAFFEQQMNAENAHRERWREGLDEAEQGAVDRRATRRRSTGSSARATTAPPCCAAYELRARAT